MAVAERLTSPVVPPHDVEAEEAVLGSMLAGTDEVRVEMAGIVDGADFYRENNGATWRAGVELMDRREPVDVLTVATRLEAAGVLERIGGRARLLQLQEACPSALSGPHYARIVKGHAIRRRLIVAGQETVQLGQELAVEPEDAVSQAAAAVFAVAQGGEQHAEALAPLLGEFLGRLEERLSNDRGLNGIRSGFYDLDRLTAGWQKGHLIVVGARPAMGKSALAMNLTATAAADGVPVAVFSLEMSKEDLVKRLVCSEASVDQARVDRGMLSGEERTRLLEATDRLGDLKLFIEDRRDLDDLRLANEARRLKMREGIGLIVVDYLQLLHTRRRYRDGDRVQEVSAVARALYELAGELEVPVIALSQLNRAPELRTSDHRPMLSDLRETGEVEQAADIVILLYRDDYYATRAKPSNEPGVAELIVSKNRHGPTGTVKLTFRKEFTRFENLAASRELW